MCFGRGEMRVAEGRRPEKHEEHDDAEGPQVDLRVVPGPQQHLGRRKTRRAAWRIRHARARRRGELCFRQTEVGKLRAPSSIEKHVFRFQISVDDADEVQRGEARGDLADDFSRVRFRQFPLALEQPEQGASRQQLKNQLHLRGRFEGVDKLNEIGVSELRTLPQYCHFSLQSCRMNSAALACTLHRNDLSCAFRPRCSHHTVCAAALDGF